ncbi:MAG: rRNA pseudouridine synthase [Planctomycetes bacterium]|nr:rRNA pseudouridine synthase [Planctomycetota bacterium]
MAAPHGFTDAGRGERLHKVLAAAGVASRRACETLIESGAVAVNGEVITTLPAWVDPARDRITVDGRRVKQSLRHLHIMLFKPRGVVSTNADPQGRRRAIDLIDLPSARARLYPAGRLDIDSSGLLLLTNDGELANRLTHPRYCVHKVYEVTVKGAVDDETVRRLEAGLFLGDRRSGSGSRTGRSRLRLIKRARQRTLLRMELGEGRNRQIRRMLAKLGYPVTKLRRIELGPLKLKGLRVGEWRMLTAGELRALKREATKRRSDEATEGRDL